MKEYFYADRWVRNNDLTFTLFYDRDNVGFSIYLLELPWKDNQKNISCILTGVYTVERDFYHKGGYEVFEYRDVPNRTEIKIHKGNWTKDILGCQATGSSVSQEKKMVEKSAKAYKKLMSYLEGIDSIQVEIRNV